MKRRIRPALMACWVGVSGTAIGAAAHTEAVEAAQAPEAVEAAEIAQATQAERAPGAAEAAEIAQATQAEEDRKEVARAAGAEETGEVAQTGAMESEEAGNVAVAGEAAESKEASESEETAEAEETSEAEEAGRAKEGPDDDAGGGLFSSILEWFRGGNAETAPDRAQDGRAGAATSVNQRFGRRSPSEPQDGGNEITPSHVYQATTDLIAEIEILRTAMNIADTPRKADLQEDRTPIHAYTKSLEVMGKTAFVQRRLGMIPVEVGRIPTGAIAPKDIYRNVQAVVEELRRVKRQLVIEDEIQPAPFAGGKTPALVYKALGDASYLLDGLAGRSTTSGEVYMQVLRVRDEMAPIAAALGITLESEPPRVEGARESKDVAQQILRATYKAINLQSRLGMGASGVPTMALEEVTPSEVFDATNLLLAELVRIQTHLGIQSQPPERRPSRDKQAADVFAQVLLIIRNLDVMTRAASDSG